MGLVTLLILLLRSMLPLLLLNPLWNANWNFINFYILPGCTNGMSVQCSYMCKKTRMTSRCSSHQSSVDRSSSDWCWSWQPTRRGLSWTWKQNSPLDPFRYVWRPLVTRPSPCPRCCILTYFLEVESVLDFFVKFHLLFVFILFLLFIYIFLFYIFF